MSDKKFTIVMIGAGPASLYATEVLAKAGHEVIILNRDIKPGGLAEFGIYPTKYKMKNGLRKYFNRVLARDNVHYFGNVKVGLEGDVTLEELRELGADALVVAVGAQGTKWLGLPGEEAPSAFHAKDLVYHYNNLPPYSEREFPVGDHVCVIGLGNVCLDIVHWLVCERQVKTVTAVARRGPGERAYTDKEFKIVSGALDVEQVCSELDAIAENLEAVGQDVEALREELCKFQGEALEKESATRFGLRFLRSPVRVEAEGDEVVGLTCEKTRLTGMQPNGRMGIEKTGEFETIPCDTVIFAIGDSIEPSLGLPLEPKWRSEFATVPEPWEAHPDRPRYMTYDPEAGEPIWDTFVVGWARRASDGLVGKARADAVQGCDEILAYLDGAFAHGPTGEKASEAVLSDVQRLLRERGVETVDFEDVKRLETIEKARAKELDVPEFKFSSSREMLDLIGE